MPRVSQKPLRDLQGEVNADEPTNESLMSFLCKWSFLFESLSQGKKPGFLIFPQAHAPSTLGEAMGSSDRVSVDAGFSIGTPQQPV